MKKVLKILFDIFIVRFELLLNLEITILFFVFSEFLKIFTSSKYSVEIVFELETWFKYLQVI
ncbi:MAG: hypothetical protein EBS19_02205 [Spirochaetia bacterium]|nr:hypothetical protein [Spirochaetia bacterium]